MPLIPAPTQEEEDEDLCEIGASLLSTAVPAQARLYRQTLKDYIWKTSTAQPATLLALSFHHPKAVFPRTEAHKETLYIPSK